MRYLQMSLGVKSLSIMSKIWDGGVLENIRACEGKTGAWVILINAYIKMDLVGFMAHVATPSSTISAPECERVGATTNACNLASSFASNKPVCALETEPFSCHMVVNVGYIKGNEHD